MTDAVGRVLLASLFWSCAACSNQFQVLERRVPDESTPVADAGIEDASAPADGAMADARSPTRDASDDADVSAPDGARPASAVSAFAQTCTLIEGALWCWGADSNGQVGTPGNNENRTRPVRIGTDEFVDVCAGEFHTCALRADGTTLCWGSNAHGQLGLGDLEPRGVPTPLDARRFVALACGGDSTCALAPRGELWCWGDNREGKLGQDDPAVGEPGNLAQSPVPVPVQTELRFAELSVGQGHVCAISEQGRLYCWGRNNKGQLGIAEPLEQARVPTAVAGDGQFTSAAAGQRHSCAIDVAGKLWCWGENNAGLLGVQSDQPSLRVPTAVGSDSDWDQVSVNWLHSCAHRTNDTLFCWGRGIEGQLGTIDPIQHDVPTQVVGDHVWRTVSTGQFHSCAVALDGLYCWGANDTGQLGSGDNARSSVPLRVAFP